MGWRDSSRAYDLDTVPEAWRATIGTVLRQRLAAHEHPDALADALEVVPRSRPFEQLAQLAEIEIPTVVVASRDEADPGHPLAVGERYAQMIPDAELVVEDAGPPHARRSRGRAGSSRGSSPIWPHAPVST